MTRSQIGMICLMSSLVACSAPETADDVDTVTETSAVVERQTTPADAALSESAVEEDAVAIRQAESHEHGGATLALVLEDGRVTAELETPLYNLIGFEREPQNETEEETVADAEDLLAKPDMLMRFNDEAGCVAEPLTEEIALFDHDDEHHHDHDDEHHDDEHHHDEAGDHEAHRDVLIEYQFTCSNPVELVQVSVTMLNEFSLMEELEVVYLGPNTQTAFDLSPTNITANLRP